MRITYATDLHGQPAQYEQLFEAAWRDKVDVLLLGGDLLPNGSMLFEKPEEDLTLQRRFLEETLRPMLEKLRRLAPRIRVFFIPGNHDWRACIEGALDDLWEPLHGQRVALEQGELVGFGLIPPSPYPIKDWERLDVPESEIEFEGSSLVSQADGSVREQMLREHLAGLPTLAEELAALPVPGNPSRTVCVFHAPPHDTNCDVIFDGRHIGSQAIRSWIETHQPLILLCGHIHESPYKTSSAYDRIGQTVICNPGAGERSVHTVTFDLGDPRAGITHSLFGQEFPFSGRAIPSGPDFTL